MMQPNRRPHAALLWTAALLASSPAWSAGDCTPGPTTLCLLESRFQVEVDWRDFDDETGDGQVLSFGTSDDAGFFWFTDPELVDLYVQMFDGTGANGHFWVFSGGLSNFEYSLRVTDTVTRSTRQYDSLLGSFLSFADVTAFPTSLVNIATGAPYPIAGALPEKGSIAGVLCSEGPTTLCLANRRFRVEVAWDPGGGPNPGQAVPLTDRSGYFWFFSPSNIELAAKIFDGGDGFFWLIFGSTTSVGYTVSVTDTCSGSTKMHAVSPATGPTSVGDFTAFPATPDCAIFTDGFESGDLSRWSNAVGD